MVTGEKKWFEKQKIVFGIMSLCRSGRDMKLF